MAAEGRIAAAAFIAFVCAGCGEGSRPAKAAWPRLLAETEIDAYRKAEAGLGIAGKSLEEIRALCLIQRKGLTPDMARFGFTPRSFLETAELIFCARHGREVFADLPRKRQALARALMDRCDGAGAGELKRRIEEELAAQSSELRDSEFVTTVLANAQILAEYERKHPPGEAPAAEGAR